MTRISLMIPFLMIFPFNPIQWWFYKWLDFSHSHHTSHDTDRPLLSSICHDMRYEIPLKKIHFRHVHQIHFRHVHHRGTTAVVSATSSGRHRAEGIQCSVHLRGRGREELSNLGIPFFGDRYNRNMKIWIHVGEHLITPPKSNMELHAIPEVS